MAQSNPLKTIPTALGHYLIVQLAFKSTCYQTEPWQLYSLSIPDGECPSQRFFVRGHQGARHILQAPENYCCCACLENQLCNGMEALKCLFFPLVSCMENISSQKDLRDVCPIKCYPSKWPRWPHSQCCIPAEPAARCPTACDILLLALEPLCLVAGHTHGSYQPRAHGAAHPLLTAVSPYRGIYQNHRAQDIAA